MKKCYRLSLYRNVMAVKMNIISISITEDNISKTSIHYQTRKFYQKAGVLLTVSERSSILSWRKLEEA